MVLNKKNIAIILSIWLVLLAAILLVNFKLFEEVKSYSSRLAFNKKAAVFFEKRASELSDFGKNFPEVQSALDEINSSFAVKDAPVDFMNFLENKAGKNNLHIKINPSGNFEEGEDIWDSLSFSVRTKGDFPPSLKFLKILETGPFFVEVFGGNIIRIEEEPGEEEPGDIKIGDANSAFNIKVFTKDKEKIK